MKKTISIIAALAIVAIFALPQTSQAQSNIMYGSSRNPLMNSANPAFFPSRARIYFALPGINLNLNSPLSYSNIFTYDSTANKTVINANNLLDTLSDGNPLRFGLGVHALGFGLDLGKFFLTLSTQVKTEMGLGLPSGLLDFLSNGNYGRTGSDAVELLNGDIVSMRAYAEQSMGVGIRLLDDALTIGARAKVLVGVLDVSNAGSSLSLTTAPDYSSLTATMDVNMNVSSAFDITMDSNGVKVNTDNISTKNMGVNFDLGSRYKIGIFDLSASVVDFGPGIHWTDNIKRFTNTGNTNSVTFSGLDVSGAMQGGTIDTTFANSIKDTLLEIVNFELKDGGEDYWSAIPTKVNLSGIAQLTEGIGVGAIFHGEFERGVVKVGDLYKTKNTGFHSRTSLLARLNLHDWVEVVAAMTVVSNNKHWDFLNPGVGITLTPFRTFQIYGFLDYISNMYIVDAKSINMSFGLNLFFGSGRRS